MPKMKFYVPGIGCDHCIRSITQALKGVKGVHSVSGDVASKTVTVDFDAPAGEKAIRDALIEIGYPAEGAGAGTA